MVMSPERTSSGVRDSGEHSCWTYASDAEHRSVLTEFFLSALDGESQLAYYAFPQPPDTLLDYLGRAGVDGEALVASGRLLLGSSLDAYTPAGVFDPDDRIAAYQAAVDDAIKRGYDGLQVAAEASWLLAIDEVRPIWPAYELRADLLGRRTPFTALCCYDLRECDDDDIDVLEAVHGTSIRSRRRLSAPMFQLQAATDGGLLLAGELDLSCAGAVEVTLAGALTDARPVIDLSGLTFADVAGTRALAQGIERSAVGEPVTLRGAPDTFAHIWSLLGYDRAHFEPSVN